jgi:hypothetical protein
VANPTPSSLARRLLTLLVNDRNNYLLKIDEYARGIQDNPYMPDSADVEYKLLAKRSVTNVMGFIENTPTQAMYVDSFRRGRTAAQNDRAGSVKVKAVEPEWDHWQKSRLDTRQHAIYRGAFRFGHAFVLTEKDKKKDQVLSKGLSALATSALYEDPANDNDPYAALTVTAWPTKGEKDSDIPGKARMWDAKNEYEVRFKSSLDFSKGITVKRLKAHGGTECPVTRFAAAVDLEGRTVGVVEPMMPIQDRINQTVFDLLVVQSFASFKVRTISGMAPPMKMVPVDENGEVVEGNLDHPDTAARIVDWEPLIVNGKPVPDDVNLNARRFFFAEDHETRFDTLDETPLDGFIKAIEMGFRHMAALSQTPPHHILGEIANLSAEALLAAETALSRKVEEFKSAFGESWERVFRVAAQIGSFEGADDFSGEVIWRDMEQKSLAQAGDALGKLADQLGIPKRGLWPRVPGVTATELAHWEDLREDENSELALASSLKRTGSSTRPAFREPPPQPVDPAAEAA